MAVRAALALGTAVAVATPGGAAAAAPPLLRLVASAPPTFRGTGFRPHEPVRVTLQMGGARRSVRLTAGSRSGMVTARLPARECAAP